jgi:hypothetical protein
MRLLSSLLVLVPLLFFACSPSAWAPCHQASSNDVDASLGAVQSALGVADLAFRNAESSLRPDQRSAARARYDRASLAVQHAMAAVRAAHGVADDAGQANPDVRGAVRALLATLDALVQVVCETRGLARGADTEPCLEELRQHVALVRQLLGVADAMGGGP